MSAEVFARGKQGALTFDNGAGHLDVLLTGHEDENVAGRIGEMNLKDLLDGAVDVVLARRLAVEDFDRESATRDREERGRAVEVRELGRLKRERAEVEQRGSLLMTPHLGRVHRRGGNDELEIPASGQD